MQWTTKSIPPHSFSGLGERRVDRRAVGDVAMAEHMRAEFCGERAHALLQRLALIGEGELGAGGARGLGDAPGDRTVVGDAEDHALEAAHRPDPLAAFESLCVISTSSRMPIVCRWRSSSWNLP